MKKLSPGTAGWISVGAVVVTAELLDSKTMSEAFREASRHPIAGPIVITVWGVLTAHLLGFLPPKYDPFKRATSHVPRRRTLLWRAAPGLRKMTR